MTCGYECPECGSTNPPQIERSIEGSDRDGNRGVKVKWWICVDCGCEENDAPF